MADGYLAEWLHALEGPKDPPFKRDGTFEGEAKRFFRLFAVSATLTAGVLGLDLGINLVLLKRGFETSPFVLKSVVMLGLIAVLYAFYSRIFGIRVNFIQVFFAFSFAILPWAPIIAALVVAGHFPILFFVFEIGWWGLLLHVLWLITRSISIITGVRQFRVALSLLFGVLTVVVPYLTSRFV